MRIWAHRGCCYRFPENTLMSFAPAGRLAVTGIELDIQLSRDGEIVVIHDERVDRTTDGTGFVKDMTLRELKALKIRSERRSDSMEARIPTMEEVFCLLEKPCRERGLLINIELKNSEVRYEGMEEKILAMTEKFGLRKNVIYSSFLPDSVRLLKELDPSVSTGMLAIRLSECMEMAPQVHADALHPYVGALDADPKGAVVRAWNIADAEPFFPSEEPFVIQDLAELERRGVTDLFTNIPEAYVS